MNEKVATVRDDIVNSESADSVSVEKIVKIFRETLGPDVDVDSDTDFFLAGGNSILAARVVAQIRRSTEIPVTMRDILFARNARSLATGLIYEKTADRPYFQQ
jgi:acyl carrier protein